MISRQDLLDWCQAAAQLPSSVFLAGNSSADLFEESAAGPQLTKSSSSELSATDPMETLGTVK